MPSSGEARIRVWDLPVRLVHGLLVVLVAGLYLTGEIGGFDLELPWFGGTLYLANMDLHAWLGQGVLFLLAFRLIWGFVGGSSARFSDFVRGPAAALAYLGQVLRGRLPATYGHNPAGGWMVLLLLGLLLTQALTGLFASDDFFFSGPLAHRVDSATSERLTSLHKLVFKLVLAAVAFHVLAAFYYLVRGKNLIAPMVTGVKRRSEFEALSDPPPRFVAWWRAWLVWLLAAALIFALRQL